MSRSRPALITHLLAVLAGVLAVAWWHSAAGSHAGVALSPEAAPAKSPQRERAEAGATSPREMLEALRWMPMSAARRSEETYGLWCEWAKADPKGMLAYLEGKAWPGAEISSFGFGLQQKVFGELALKDPAWLIAYARRHGSIAAWEALSDRGDPNVVFRLLASEKEPIPAAIYTSLFEKGAAVTSSFHQHLAEIQDPAAKAAAFEGAAPALLELSRIGDFMSLVSDAGIDGKQAGEAFGKFCAEQSHPELLGEIGSLPPEARVVVVAKVMEQLDSFGSHRYAEAEKVMEGLGSLSEADGRAWAASDPEWQETLEGAIRESLRGDGDAREKVWYDWALKLPSGELATVMKRAAFKRWAEDSGPDWQPRLAAITDPALHDMAAATLVQWLSDEKQAAAAAIKDEALREKTLKELRGESGEEDPPEE